MIPRAAVVADAFVQQMEQEASRLKDAKQSLETAIAGGSDLKDVTANLDAANEMYKKTVSKFVSIPQCQRHLLLRLKQRQRQLQSRICYLCVVATLCRVGINITLIKLVDTSHPF